MIGAVAARLVYNATNSIIVEREEGKNIEWKKEKMSFALCPISLVVEHRTCNAKVACSIQVLG